MKQLIALLCLVVVFKVHAGLLYPYGRLATHDLDKMKTLISNKIKESRKEKGGDKSIPLKEALQAVFSRPNEDFLIEKILPILKNEMDDQNCWEKSVKALVKEATGALKNPRAFKPEAQVTYIIFLENLMAEFKPKVAEPFEAAIIRQIQDAKISLTREALNERKLRMMKDMVSPSDLAEHILAEYKQKQEQEAEAQHQRELEQKKAQETKKTN